MGGSGGLLPYINVCVISVRRCVYVLLPCRWLSLMPVSFICVNSRTHFTVCYRFYLLVIDVIHDMSVFFV